MRILITGGAGFIGSHLTERLHDLGHDLVVLDDLSSGDAANLAAVIGGRCRLQLGCAADADLVDACMHGVDVVYHLAATVGVRRAVADPLGVFGADLAATACVVRAARRHSVGVVFASSSEVYGRSRDVPFREDRPLRLPPPTESRWGYAGAKAAGECLLLQARRTGEIPFAAVVRLFNTVGDRQKARQGMVLARFREQLRNGVPLTVHGTGRQTRCFVHVSDIVDAMVRVPHEPRLDGQIINLGHDEEVSIREVVARMARLLGMPDLECRFVPYPEAYPGGFEDVPRRSPDLTKARQWLGFSPRYDLDALLTDLLLGGGKQAPESPAEFGRIRSG